MVTQTKIAFVFRFLKPDPDIIEEGIAKKFLKVHTEGKSKPFRGVKYAFGKIMPEKKGSIQLN
jgi:hypothetical protein